MCYFALNPIDLILRYKHGGSSLVGTTNAESILRNELGPAREEKRRKAGKKDKGRDLTRVPTLYWQAWLRVAGCKRVLRDRWLVLSKRDRLRENAKPREHGIYGAKMSKETKAYALSSLFFLDPKGGYTLLFTALIKCAFMRILLRADITYIPRIWLFSIYR